jgi:hypothetical protein
MAYRQGIGWLLIALGVLPLLALLLAPRPAQAQADDPPSALTVTIRDTHGQSVAGAFVKVLARSGGQVFAQAMTDAEGLARIDTLPTGDLRVQVTGSWQGVTLTQTGADAGGVLLLGGDPPLRLDLRVTADGHVIPDPATMVTPDLAGPRVPIPTAPVAGASAESGEQPELPEATTLVGPASAGLAEGHAPTSDSVAPEPASAPSTRSAGAPDGSKLVLVALALLACLVLTIAIARWVRPA